MKKIVERLSKEEELRLGKIISTINQKASPTEVELIERDEAISKLFLNYEDLCYSLAHKFIKQTSSGFFYSIEEASQDAKVGLITAIQKYDYSKNTKLGTYAWYYIQKELSTKIRLYRPNVAYDSKIYGKMWGLKYFKHKYKELENPTMTEKEFLMEKCRIKNDYEWNQIELFISNHSSLEFVVDVHQKSQLKDNLVDETTLCESSLSRNSLSPETKELIEKLQNEDDKAIILYEFGFYPPNTNFEAFLSSQGILNERSYNMRVKKILKELGKIAKKGGFI